MNVPALRLSGKTALNCGCHVRLPFIARTVVVCNVRKRAKFTTGLECLSRNTNMTGGAAAGVGACGRPAEPLQWLQGRGGGGGCTAGPGTTGRSAHTTMPRGTALSL
jgi:hypothetical protein